MATKFNQVTELKFYDVKDVMRITGWAKIRAYKAMKEINDKLKAEGKMTIRGKVNAVSFNAMFQ